MFRGNWEPETNLTDSSQKKPRVKDKTDFKEIGSIRDKREPQNKVSSSVVKQNQPEYLNMFEQEETWEEWMMLSDLHTPFDNSEQTPELTYDWHLKRDSYSEQQSREVPT